MKAAIADLLSKDKMRFDDFFTIRPCKLANWIMGKLTNSGLLGCVKTFRSRLKVNKNCFSLVERQQTHIGNRSVQFTSRPCQTGSPSLQDFFEKKLVLPGCNDVEKSHASS